MTDSGRLCVFDLSTSVPIDGGEGAKCSNGYAGAMNVLTFLVLAPSPPPLQRLWMQDEL